MATTASEWVREIQRQAVAKGKPYDAAEFLKLADSAHIWAMHYGLQLSHGECRTAARQLLGLA